MPAMRPLAFSTNAFKKDTLDGAIDAIADAGYAAVELMADVPHAYPLPLEPDRLAALKQRLTRRSLVVSNINAFTLFAEGDTYHPTWIEDDPALRRRRVQHTIAAVDLAHSLSARTVSLQPGGPLLGSHLSSKVAAERFAAGLAEVLPHARKLGITLAVEPEPGLLIQTSAEYLQFKQQYFASDGYVRMNCDIGHLFCVGEDPAAVIRALPEQVVHVHLEDIGANRVHQHLCPGKGAIDFKAVFAALDAIGYGGWVTVELYPYEATAALTAQAAMAHLSSLSL